MAITCTLQRAGAQTPSPSVGDEGGSSSPLTVQEGGLTKQGVQSVNTLLTITPYLTPNPTATSWAAARDNAMVGIITGQPVAGSAVSSFTPLPNTTLSWGDVALTSFSSWRGQANPPAPYNLEKGNSPRFGLKIVSGTLFRLSDLSWAITSTDVSTSYPQGSLYFAGSFATNSYAQTRQGFVYGANGTRGPAITSGPGDTLVNEIDFIGVANAYVADSTDGLIAIRDYVAQSHPLSLTVTYSIRIGARVESASKTVSLSGQKPFMLQIVPLGNGFLSLSLSGGDDGIYEIQGTTVAKGTWSSLIPNINRLNGGVFQTAVPNTGKAKFFRAVKN